MKICELPSGHRFNPSCSSRKRSINCTTSFVLQADCQCERPSGPSSTRGAYNPIGARQRQPIQFRKRFGDPSPFYRICCHLREECLVEPSWNRKFDMPDRVPSVLRIAAQHQDDAAFEMRREPLLVHRQYGIGARQFAHQDSSASRSTVVEYCSNPQALESPQFVCTSRPLASSLP